MTRWKTYRLGDIIDKVIDNRGKSAPTSDEKYSPIIEINSIGDRNPNYDVVRKWVSKDTYDTWFRSGHPMIGDILIPTVGTIGIVSMMRENKGCIAQNIVALRTNEKAHNLYLYYFLKSGYAKQELLNLNIGGVQPSIKVPHLLNLEISLPPLQEQRRIAGILSAIDDKIENNRRINDNLEQQAQALYKQWFVDNRNEDWETLTLDDVATISAGGDKPQICSEKKTSECNIPIYSNGIDNEGLYGYTNNPRIIENSVTISARGTIGFVCLRTEPYVPIVRLISVIPTYDNMSAYFLYLWALTQNISGTGTTQQQLTVPAFRTTQIVVPSQEILIRFNNVVKPIFDCIKQNKVENETLATLRDTLLPKLMNGEIKL